MSELERLYKVLNDDGSCYHGGRGHWKLPTADGPGDWMPKLRGALEPCRRGYHLCREADLVNWLGPVIWIAEYEGDRVDVDSAVGGKVVVRRARILSRVSNWDAQIARLFACDCAERALNREREHGREPDARSWESIAVARRFARGGATQTELDAAGDAAGAAAWAAAWAAARAAARAAAGAAAGAAVRDAARAAAWAAAGAAARDAAWAAAGAAAGAAARDAERHWQTNRLSWYLAGQPAEMSS